MLKTPIPFIDLREKSLIDLLRAYPDKAHELIKASRRIYGPLPYAASAALLPISDRISRHWLKKSYNPFIYEIESFAEILGVSGVYTLNVSGEWGCTSGVFRNDESVSMLRVLDWPVATMGKNLMVTWQKGREGDFYNLTWPGMSGVYTAMAPGRFSAAINQAPMRKHKLGWAGDWAKNRVIAYKDTSTSPEHLLREVFEQANNYDMAKKVLSCAKVAAPVIYTLAGARPGQGCVIERTENTFQVRDLAAGQQVTATNHFNTAMANTGHGWRPRRIDSAGRYRQSCSIHGHDLQADDFNWLQAPIINQYTRLCAIADAKTNRFTVQGFEGMAQVTDVFNLPAETYEQKYPAR